MKKEILLSVLMPVYNAQKYLSSAIESVLAQTLTNFELLIIDDGSTDDSLSIIKQYAAGDLRVKYLSRENKGLVFTLNELVNIASAKIIARMDADDTIAADRFSDQFQAVREGGENIVCGSWVKTTNQLNEVWHYRQADNFTKNLLLTGITPFCHASMMCHKKLLEENPYLEEFEYLEDYALFCQLTAGNKVFFYNIPKVLYFYNIHSASICGQQVEIQNKKRALILQRFISDFKTEKVSLASCINFLCIRSKAKISFNELTISGNFLQYLAQYPHAFNDEHYVFAELLLTLALKCEDKEQAKSYWQQHPIYPACFSFIKEKYFE